MPPPSITPGPLLSGINARIDYVEPRHWYKQISAFYYYYSTAKQGAQPEEWDSWPERVSVG